MKKDCKIIQDLLPNYIEKLTNEETNVFVQEHLKECEECKKVYESMKKELDVKNEGIEVKEVNYIKKFSKKMKVLRRILSVILILFVVIVGRRVIILTSLQHKAQETKKDTPSNYYAKVQSYSGKDMSIIESYNDGEDYFVTFTNFSEERGKIVNKWYKLGDESFRLSETEGKKVISKTGSASINPISFTSEMFIENLFLAIASSVEKIEINGKECYIIRDGNTEKFIDIETGYAIRLIDNANNRIVDYHYKFGVVEDKHLEKPDTTGYVEVE